VWQTDRQKDRHNDSKCLALLRRAAKMNTAEFQDSTKSSLFLVDRSFVPHSSRTRRRWIGLHVTAPKKLAFYYYYYEASGQIYVEHLSAIGLNSISYCWFPGPWIDGPVNDNRGAEMWHGMQDTISSLAVIIVYHRVSLSVCEALPRYLSLLQLFSVSRCYFCRTCSSSTLKTSS